MGKSASPPPMPDYVGAAREQGAANVEAARTSARLSNPNIIGPLGTQTVTYEGDIPTVKQTLTPHAQATLEAQQQVDRQLAELGLQGIGSVRDVLGTPFQTQTQGLNTTFDLSGLPKAPVNAGTTAQEAILARLEPNIARSRAALEAQLANQGIARGSEAYAGAMTQQEQQENDLRLQAAARGIDIDRMARAQGFEEQRGSKTFENEARINELQRELALRGQPLNEIIGLMGGSQLMMPQFQSYSGATATPAPIFGAAQAQGSADMQRYGIEQAGANAGMQGISSLAGTAAGLGLGLYALSDERLKSNVERVGTHPLGIGIYDYDIGGERQRGVMAQDVAKVKPEAVAKTPSGYLAVNYGAL